MRFPVTTVNFFLASLCACNNDLLVVEGRKSKSAKTESPTPSTPDPAFYYDNPSSSAHERKTNSYMPFMPALDGHVQTHKTFRFLAVREQVLTVIGEAKHGMWRIHDNGMVRLYRKFGSTGVPVGADVSDASLQDAIMSDYKPVLAPGLETSDTGGWAGYRYSQDDDGDGRAAFVDVPIYHPYFNNAYDDHVAIDLPHWFCTMSGANFTEAQSVWKYASKQPNANQVGPLGKRAGLDIKEHYTNIIKFDMFPDAKLWIQVGLGDDTSRDVFDQNDIDQGNMAMDIAYRALDTSKVDYEVYLIERPFFNVPYIFITIVMKNKDNPDMQYIRPAGLYWDELVEKGLTTGLKTVMTYDPMMPVVDDGVHTMKTMRYTPLYGLNHLDRPNDDGSGGWCPQKGGDWGSYPSQPGGSGFPNQYEEATPVCDGLVVDIKMYANLDKPSWDSPTFQLQNAGTAENPQVYFGEGNQYGDFTDPYLTENGFVNPHKLHFTGTSNPDPKPGQTITLTFEGVGEVNTYIDPVTGDTVPSVPGLTEKEHSDREAKIAATSYP